MLYEIHVRQPAIGVISLVVLVVADTQEAAQDITRKYVDQHTGMDARVKEYKVHRRLPADVLIAGRDSYVLRQG